MKYCSRFSEADAEGKLLTMEVPAGYLQQLMRRRENSLRMDVMKMVGHMKRIPIH